MTWTRGAGRIVAGVLLSTLIASGVWADDAMSYFGGRYYGGRYYGGRYFGGASSGVALTSVPAMSTWVVPAPVLSIDTALSVAAWPSARWRVPTMVFVVEGGAAFTLTIGGVDVVPYLDVDSLRIETPLNAVCTLSAQIQDDAGSYRPTPLQEVVFSHYGVPLFRGVILTPTEQDFSLPSGIATDLDAVDYSARLDHVYVSLETNDGDTLRAVVDAICAAGNLEADFGITRAPGMAEGPTLTAQTFTDATVRAALQRCSDLSQWPFRVDPDDKTLIMAAVGSESAPSVLQDGVSAWILGPAQQTLGEYGNRQRVRIGAGARVVPYTFLGDGTTRVFPLPLETAARPAQVYDVGAAAYRNVGVYGVDLLFEWTYRSSDNTIVQLAEAPPGTAHDPIALDAEFQTVDWVAQFPFTVSAEDAGEIAARGVWERAPVDVPDLFDIPAGQALAEALIDRYAVWPPPRQVPAVVWAHGFRAGQQATLVSSARNLSGSWLITDVAISVERGMVLRYDLTLIEGGVQQAGFREFWKGLSGTGGGGSVSGGGIIGGSVSGGHYAHELGGSEFIDVTDTAWTNVPNEVPWVCPADGTYSVRVEAWTRNAGTTCTPRLWDVTAGVAAGTGSASASTSRLEQLLPITGVAGHRYLLQVAGSNLSAGVFALGSVEG